MPRSTNPLTPAQRSERAKVAANTRWAHEPDRLAATKPGRDAAFQKLLDEVDPQGVLSEAERVKRAKNLAEAQLASARLRASRLRQQQASERAAANQDLVRGIFVPPDSAELAR